MSRRLRLVITGLVGLIVLAGAASFAPRAVPVAPPPVRLEGPVVETDPSQNELVVVPNPSVDLGNENPIVTTTTVRPDEGVAGSDPDPVASPDEPVDPPIRLDDDSADSVGASAASPDDD